MADEPESNGKGARPDKPESRGAEPTTDKQASAGCPVVGLGASAGGIDAFQTFFDNVPENSGIAYVVVLHLSPDATSHLAELLSRFTEMPVTQVSETTEIEPDHVYVIKPGTVLRLEAGGLHPRTIHDPSNGRRTPIDQFFYSLAEEQGEDAACVILSGSGSDGTLGLRAVKEQGGLSLVQTPETAEHGGMMMSAIATGLVDQVLDVAEMPAAIAGYFERLEENRKHASRDGTRPDVLEHLPKITSILYERTNHDFSNYKRASLARRVQRRMQATRNLDPDSYLERLRDDPEESTMLLKDLLIGVTEFFRDPEAFAALGEQAIPKIFEDRSTEEPVRAWVVGCATGEEAYSIAILLLEQARKADNPPEITVFASDIDTHALNVGRRGQYPASALEHVSEELAERYFTGEGDVFTVRDFVREHVLFAEHNVLRDPPFARIDLVSCRNLLIYLESNIQERVLQMFHYALRDRGYLFLGASETVGRETQRFQALDRRARIYRPQAGREQHLPDLPLVPQAAWRRSFDRDKRQKGRRPPAIQSYEKLIIDKYAPAWVVVDESLRVREFSARTGKFLEAPAGEPTYDLPSLARDTLRRPLRAALNKVLRTGEREVCNDLTVDIDGARQSFDLVVEPIIADESTSEKLALVVFDETEPLRPAETSVSRYQQYERGDGREPGEGETEDELKETQARLQATKEELETSNEELKASNEELASMNEELQSSNEELETSKEELQSSNEELQTVNAELNERVEDLARANDDLRNFFENTHVPTLFVDKELRVRSYTPALTDIFHVVETDKGRALKHIASRLDDERFVDDIAGVIQDLQKVAREVRLKDSDGIYMMRIQPYRTRENRIEGAVLTFVDITEVKESETHLRESEQHQRLLLRELQHRVKNILANVRGLANQTYEQSADLEGFFEAFQGRLDAMARVQAMLGQGRQEDVELEDLILEEFLAHAARPDREVEVNGPAVQFESRAAQTFALAIHELATNAVKYGALLAEEGRIAVSWRIEDTGDGPVLDFEWQESGVALEDDVGSGGFGRRLIEEALPYELGGTAHLEFSADGCRCVMQIPFDGRIKRGQNAGSGEGED